MAYSTMFQLHFSCTCLNHTKRSGCGHGLKKTIQNRPFDQSFTIFSMGNRLITHVHSNVFTIYKVHDREANRAANGQCKSTCFKAENIKIPNIY